MTTMRKKATLADGTPIQALAARLVERSGRLDQLLDSGDDDHHRLLVRELRFLRDSVLDLTPRNLKDATVLTMAAYDAAAELGVDEEDDAGRLAAALRRLLRFLADASGVDLEDCAGGDFIIEDLELGDLPELVA